MKFKRILIIADIEGSSACPDRDAARFLGKGWPLACLGMTLDVDTLARSLFNAGADHICIYDFHRTGYNIFPDLIHPRARLIQGYRLGPVPGMGSPGPFDGHTLTSRLSGVYVNGQPVSEAQLFSAALAPLGIPPLFFSGCPEACAHTRKSIPGIQCFEINKETFGFSAERWRKKMASACVSGLCKAMPLLYNPQGPFQVRVSLAQGPAAASKIAHRWQLDRTGAHLEFEAMDFNDMFRQLSRLAYLSPLTERLLPVALPLYRLFGRAGQAWAKRKAPVLK